jgi:SAM-dependent methyltransferase
VTTDDPCWICGNPGATPYAKGTVDALTTDDLRISDKRYGMTLPLLRCDACGFVFARRESLPALTALYAELDDAEYEGSAAGRDRQMAHLLRWATTGVPRPARLLDVGAASGILVREATALGFRSVGVEPSGPLARRARDGGLEVHEGVLPHPALDGARFDVVTLVDVIEHVDDPLGLLALCRGHLAPHGRLVVVTPDRGSVAARMLGRRWWHRRLAHVCYFDRSTLTAALDRSGLAPERWARPRWYLPLGYLLSRMRQYVPRLWPRRGAATAAAPAERSEHGGLVVPFNLRDSYAVVARAA